MQVTIPVPHPGTKVSQKLLNDLRTIGVFPGMQLFASLVEHGTVNGFPSYKRNRDGASKKPKYFTSHSHLGVFIKGALPLTQASPGMPPPSFSDFSFSIYSRAVATFYMDRCIAGDEQFLTRGIPRLVLETYDDPGKMNFDLDEGKKVEDLSPRMVTEEEQAWPLGTIFPNPQGAIEYAGMKWTATFPTDHGLKFNLVTGQPEIFHYQKYNEAFPLETIVRVKGSGGGASAGTPRVKTGQEMNFMVAVAACFTAANQVEAVNSAVAQFVEVK